MTLEINIAEVGIYLMMIILALMLANTTLDIWHRHLMRKAERLKEENFLLLYNAFFGDNLTRSKQLVKHTFTGEELKEFITFIINKRA